MRQAVRSACLITLLLALQVSARQFTAPVDEGGEVIPEVVNGVPRAVAAPENSVKKTKDLLDQAGQIQSQRRAQLEAERLDRQRRSDVGRRGSPLPE
jgi:hypothetical protein